MRFWMAGLLLLSVFMPGNDALADCRAEGQQAVNLLMNFKQSALSNQAVDSQQFKAQFEPVVYKMKQDGCMNELMGLMTLIQSEQQQYPAPASTAHATH